MQNTGQMDFLSERAAAYLLPLSRTQARRVLECGLAGAATVTAHRHLYAHAQVAELAERPVLTTGSLRDAGLAGLNVLRVPPSLPSVTVRDHDALTAWASGPWLPGWPVGLLLTALVKRRIATAIMVGPFVAATYDAIDVTLSSEGVSFTFSEAREWAAVLERRQWHLGRGGRTYRYLDLSGRHDQWFG